MSFKIYEKILTEVKKCKLVEITPKQKNELLEKLKVTDVNHHKTIYCIMRKFAHIHDPSNSNLPYGGTPTKKGVRFDIEELPVNLNLILWYYLTHLEQLESDAPTEGKKVPKKK